MVIALWVAIFLFTVVLHEVAHGLVAYCRGDTTAKDAGRLSLNPLRHIDPFWTVLLPATLFIATRGHFAIGMAKPVPVNFARLHNPKRDMIWVALAGPATNIALAFILNFFFRLSENVYLLYGIYFNLGLAMFNLIPIPPLDGSRILAGLLPNSWLYPYLRLERYGFLVIMLLYFTGVLFYLIMPAVNLFCVILEIPRLGVTF